MSRACLVGRGVRGLRWETGGNELYLMKSRCGKSFAEKSVGLVIRRRNGR